MLLFSTDVDRGQCPEEAEALNLLCGRGDAIGMLSEETGLTAELLPLPRLPTELGLVKFSKFSDGQ